MSDPLSVAASVGGLALLAAQVIKTVQEFVRDVRESKEEVKELLMGLSTLYGALKSLQIIVESFDQDHGTDVLHTEVITSCSNTLHNVQRRLELSRIEPANPPSAGGPSNNSKLLHNAKQRLCWPFKKDEIKTLLSKLEATKSTLNLAVAAESMASLRGLLGRQKNNSAMMALIRKTQLDENAHRLSKEQRNTLSLFMNVDPSARHTDLLKQRYPGTVTWFLESPEYQDFLRNKNASMWLYGIPGSGKSVLAASLIQALEAMPMDSNACAFFYCDHANTSTQDLGTILSCITAQLARQNEEALQDLLAFHEKHMSTYNSQMTFRHEALTELIHSMCTHFDTTTIVIDGLDECSTDREHIVSSLAALSRHKELRTILVSREELNIKEALSDFTRVSIAATSADVKLFVAAALESRSMSKKPNNWDPNLKVDILKRLVDDSKGMFQWAKCQLDFLFALSNDRARRKALNSLPPTLPATYERILTRANEDAPDAETRAQVRRTLQWVALAKEPLTADAIMEAISIELEDSSLDWSAVPEENAIRRLCGSLIREGPDKRLHFSHFSVREFLEQIDPDKTPSIAEYRIEPRAADEYLGKICLTYCLLENFDDGPPKDEDALSQQLTSFKFLDYAVLHWNEHLNEDLERDDIQEIVFRLLSPSKSNQYLNWAFHKLRQYVHEQNIAVSRISLLLQDTIPLHFACSMGIRGVAQKCILAGDTVNKRSDVLGTPLLCSIDTQGMTSFPRKDQRCKLVEDLLHARASHDSVLHDAVDLAIVNKNERILEILLENGFSLTKRALARLENVCQDEGSWVGGLLKSIQAVSEKNLNADTSPLYVRFMAQYGSHIGSLEPLIAGAPDFASMPEQLRENHMENIGIAARHGQLSYLQNLLRQLPKVGTSDHTLILSKCLIAAADSGHTETVRFLLSAGADPLYESKIDSALHRAITNKHLDTVGSIIQYLKVNNDDIAQENSHGSRSLHYAAISGSLEIFRLVLGADPDEALNVPNKNGFTCMHLVMASGKAEIFQHLRNAGVPVSDRNKNGIAPIHVLLCPDIVKFWYNFEPPVFRQIFHILLEKEIDLDPATNSGENIIHWLFRGVPFQVRYSGALDAWNILAADARCRELVFAASKSLNSVGDSPLHIGITNFCNAVLHSFDDSINNSPYIDERLNIRKQCVHLIELACANGNFSLDTEDKYGRTPLSYLCFNMQSYKPYLDFESSVTLEVELLTLTRALIGAERDSSLNHINRQTHQAHGENTALHYVANWGSTLPQKKVMKLFIERNVDLKVINTSKRNILMETANNLDSTRTLLELLLQHAEEDDISRSDDQGRSLLHSFCENIAPIEIIERFIPLIAASVQQDTMGNIPLHCCARGITSKKLLQQIIALAEKNFSKTNENGDNVMTIACRVGNVNMMTTLIENGYSINAKVFVKTGSSPKPEDSYPLFLAATHGQWDAVRLLLCSGADTTIRDSSGRQFHHLACKDASEPFLDILESLPSLDYSSEATLTMTATGREQIIKSATPLHFAACAEDPSGVEWLSQHGHISDINLKAHFGCTALHLAAFNGADKVCQRLIDFGADVSLATDVSQTPLYYAAMAGSISTCMVLLSAGASVNPEDVDLFTPLHIASMKGYSGIAQLFLEHGGDPMKRNKYSMTAEMVALGKRHLKTFEIIRKFTESQNQQYQKTKLEIPQLNQYLLSLPGTPNPVDTGYSSSVGRTSLREAAIIGDIQLCKALLLVGADVDESDGMTSVHPVRLMDWTSSDAGMCTCTPLLLALFGRFEDIVSLFLEHGADWEISSCHLSPLPQSLPIHLAVSSGYTRVTKMLLELGSSFLDPLANTGETAVHLAIRSRQADSLAMMFQNDHAVDPDTVFPFKHISLLHFAVSMGSMACASILCKAGANPNALSSRGDTPLHWAVETGDIALVKLLYKHGANIHIRNLRGDSLLHVAARGTGLETLNMVLWCLENGINPNIPNLFGETPIECAVTGRVVKVLLDHGANLSTKTETYSSPFHVLCGRSYGLEYVASLLADNSPTEIVCALSQRSKVYGTPLYYASQCGLLQTVVYLVNRGAEVNTIGGNLGAPIHVAWRQRRFNIVSYLMSKNSKPCLRADANGEVACWYWEYGNSFLMPSPSGAWNVSTIGMT